MPDSFHESLSADGLDAIEPYLPYLLQDLTALGCCPETAISLMERAGTVPGTDELVTDLGCGKGAMLIALSKRFGCRGHGADLVPEFIGEARDLARKNGVSDRVEFAVADMRAVIHEHPAHAWIVYGHDAPIFGNLRETLQSLRGALNPGGKLILDATCRKQGTVDEEAMELPLLSEIARLVAECRFDEVARVTVSPEELELENTSNTIAIARRADELKAKHPGLADVFGAYVQRQRDESEFLEKECENSYFLFRAI